MKSNNLNDATRAACELNAAIQAAHRDAIEADEGMAEIVLLQLLRDAAGLGLRIQQARDQCGPSEHAQRLADTLEEVLPVIIGAYNNAEKTVFIAQGREHLDAARDLLGTR